MRLSLAGGEVDGNEDDAASKDDQPRGKVENSGHHKTIHPLSRPLAVFSELHGKGENESISEDRSSYGNLFLR